MTQLKVTFLSFDITSNRNNPLPHKCHTYSKMIFRLGEHDISSTTDGATAVDVAIKKVTTHEGYTTTALQNDIAIVELEKPVSFRAGIRPACLPDQFSKQDLTALATQPTIVGWGSTTTGGTTVNALRQVLSVSNCRNFEFLEKISLSKFKLSKFKKL